MHVFTSKNKTNKENTVRFNNFYTCSHFSRIIGYLSTDSYDSFLWLLITLPGATVLGFIGIPTIYFSLRKAIKIQEEEKLRKIFCPFCNSELEKPDDEGPIICMSCGKKTPVCHMCGKQIMETSEVFTIVPCGHTVHKGEILDWLEKSKKCPLCDEIITKLDVDLEDD